MQQLLPTGSPLRPRGRIQQFTSETARMPLDFSPILSVRAATEALILATGIALERAQQGANVLILTSDNAAPDVVSTLNELYDVAPSRDLTLTTRAGAIAVMTPERFAATPPQHPANVLILPTPLYPEPLRVRMHMPAGARRVVDALPQTQRIAFTLETTTPAVRETLEADDRFHGLLTTPPLDPREDNTDHPLGPINHWLPRHTHTEKPIAAFGTRTRRLAELLGMSLLYTTPLELVVEAYVREFKAEPYFEAFFAYPTLPSEGVEADWGHEFSQQGAQRQ